MVGDNLRYGIVNEKTGEVEWYASITYDYDKDGNVTVHPVFPPRCVIGGQQLFELGWLFIALATKSAVLDEDSAKELLDGFEIPSPPALENWEWPGKEIANATFFSVWDDGEILTSPALVKDGKVEVLVTHDKNDSALVREYIILYNAGEEQEVCPECHECLLRGYMVPDETGNGLHELFCCPECDMSGDPAHSGK